jgi:hypothetical protein
MSILQLKTRILPGGRIEVPSSDLPEGREVTLSIVLEDEEPKRRISDILAGYPGGQLFKTGAEVDQYIKEERESWDD